MKFSALIAGASASFGAPLFSGIHWYRVVRGASDISTTDATYRYYRTTVVITSRCGVIDNCGGGG